jgi:hypothetical protein
MNKTLIEIYNDGLGLYSSLCAVFEAIDSRLYAMEHPAPPVQSAVDWLHEIDDRLSALEKPAETDREWIDLRAVYWIYYKDGSVALGHLSDCLRGFTHIKPWHEGDKQPEPPVERGA